MTKSEMWNTVIGVIMGSQLQYKNKRELIDFVRRVEADLEAMEDPQPLTLEELKQMDMKPVFVVPLQPSKDTGAEWCVMWDGEACIPGCEHWAWPIKDYGKTWTAYRHEPKEDE